MVTRVVGRLTDLDSTQEEACTRLLLYTAHAAGSKFVAVIIVSEDTGILSLCFPFKSFIPSSMLIKCSSQTRVKYSVRVERIAASTCKSLSGFYAFTSSDTVVTTTLARQEKQSLQVSDSSNHPLFTLRQNLLSADWPH